MRPRLLNSPVGLDLRCNHLSIPKGPSTQKLYACPKPILRLLLPKSQVQNYAVLGPLGYCLTLPPHHMHSGKLQGYAWPSARAVADNNVPCLWPSAKMLTADSKNQGQKCGDKKALHVWAENSVEIQHMSGTWTAVKMRRFNSYRATHACLDENKQHPYRAWLRHIHRCSKGFGFSATTVLCWVRPCLHHPRKKLDQQSPEQRWEL